MENGQLNLRSYPKVELHRHLECSLRFSSLLEIAKDLGMDLPQSAEKQKEHFLIREPMKDLGAVLHKFLRTQAVLHSEEILTRLTFEVIEDAANEGIKILELRYAPTFIQEAHPQMSFEKIHQAILKGMAQAKNIPIAVGLLAIIQRTKPLPLSEQVADFVIDSKDSWIGVDLADDEENFPAPPFQSIFKKFKKAGLPITIHAGETSGEIAPQNVKDSIELLGATRIGHGLQIIKNPQILNFVREHKIPLEICPTSNWLTNAIPSLDAHPIRKLIDAGVLVTINSDDPGVFDLDLTSEYELLQKKYQFTKADFDRSNDIAAHASFIPLDIKQKVWPRKIT